MSELAGVGLAERLGGAEGPEGGEGGGAGVGGLCANVTGARTAIAITRPKKLRMPWLIDRS